MGSLHDAVWIDREGFLWTNWVSFADCSSCVGDARCSTVVDNGEEDDGR